MLGYDLIGDIHGCADELEKLLAKLDTDPERKLVFLGDFIDRGPYQQKTLELVQRLIAEGRAVSVMGNHEYNAIMRSMGLRTKHDSAHDPFLEIYPQGSSRYNEAIAWMKKLPLWLDLPHLGVVHACFHPLLMQKLEHLLDEEHRALSDEFFRLSAKPKDGGDAEIYDAVETILKGTELNLPEGCSFKDKENNVRHEIRTKWWLDSPTHYHEVCLTTPLEQIPNAEIPAGSWHCAVPQKTIVVGHYWLFAKNKHAPTLEESELCRAKVYCVDFSCVKGGALCCLRVDLDATGICAVKLVSVPSAQA